MSEIINTGYATLALLVFVELSEVVNTTEKPATIAAIIIGGIWAYYRFFKGRTFSTRFDSTVKGEITRKDRVIYLIVDVEIDSCLEDKP